MSRCRDCRQEVPAGVLRCTPCVDRERTGRGLTLLQLRERAELCGAIAIVQSHYDHALDQADPDQSGRELPTAQRSRGLECARVLRAVLVAFGVPDATTRSLMLRHDRVEAEGAR